MRPGRHGAHPNFDMSRTPTDRPRRVDVPPKRRVWCAIDGTGDPMAVPIEYVCHGPRRRDRGASGDGRPAEGECLGRVQGIACYSGGGRGRRTSTTGIYRPQDRAKEAEIDPGRTPHPPTRVTSGVAL